MLGIVVMLGKEGWKELLHNYFSYLDFLNPEIIATKQLAMSTCTL